MVMGSTGVSVTCDQAVKSLNDTAHCPEMYISAIAGNVTRTYPAGSLIGPWQTGALNVLQGEFTVDAFMDSAELVMVYVTGVHDSVDILMDDLTIVKGTPWTCAQGLVRNAGGEDGSSRSWVPWLGGSIKGVNATALSPAKDGNFFLSSSGRTLSAAGIQQVLNPACFALEGVYSISAWVKLTNGGTDLTCDPVSTVLSNRCPLVEVLATNTGGPGALRAIGGFSGLQWTTGWNEITGRFQFFDMELAASTLSLIVAEAPTNMTMYVDKIEIQRVM
jgi:hypothetical protein